MIDVNLPLELEDGRTARYVSPQEALATGEIFEEEAYGEESVLVEITGPYAPYDPETGRTVCFWYRKDTGEWDGGDGTEYKIRNVDREEDYESDF
jgi:hypothetical protein